MRIVLQCEKCCRPAETEQQQKVEKNAFTLIDRKVRKVCLWGGKIIPMID